MSRYVSNEQLSSAVLEHFWHPRHGGELKPGAGILCTGEAGAVKSATLVRFQLRIESDGRIADVGWQAYGCPSTLASASWLAENVLGRSVADVKAISAFHISQSLQLAPERRARAVVVEDAFRSALKDYEQDMQREVK